MTIRAGDRVWITLGVRRRNGVWECTAAAHSGELAAWRRADEMRIEGYEVEIEEQVFK